MTFSSIQRSFLQLMLAGLVAAALLLGLNFVLQDSQAAAPEDIPATVEIMTSADDVQAGDSYDAFIRMTFTGSEGPVDGQLNFNIGMPPSASELVGVKARVIEGQSNGIQTVKLRKSGTQIQWRGRMQAGGHVTIGVRVKTAACHDDNGLQHELQAEAMLAGSSETTSDNIFVRITCLTPLTGEDVSITKRILTRNTEDDGWDEGVAALVGNRERVGLQINVTNKTDAPIVALVSDSMNPDNPEDEDSCFFRVIDVTNSDGRNISLNPNSFAETFGNEDALSLSLDVEPGETRTTTLEGGALSSIIDCMLSGQAGVRAVVATAVGEDDETVLAEAGATASAAVHPRLRLIKMLADVPVIESNAVTMTVVAPDLGDAPDSSNHFGAGMTAYPGTPATFPTVFDAATGAPPGPRHRMAPPLHLGPQVSREREADLNPNRNLDPTANLADLDNADDGVGLGALNLAACQPTPVAVRVAVGQKAVDHFDKTGGTAYLNVWIDGNRDGDWADSINCGQQIGAGLEHIVINQTVDVKALGTGLHTISVQSQPVYWPQPLANRPAWLRVSLSDQPAPTGLNAGGVSHGDGRGPATGYLLGETEDYLFVSEDTPDEFLIGPDMMVETDYTVEETEETAELSSQARRGRQQLNYQVRFRNRGDRPSLNTRVQIFTEPYLGVPAAAEDKHDWYWGCLTCTVASSIQSMNVSALPEPLPMHEVCDDEDNCHIEIDMMEVPVGKGGQKILRWNWLPEIGDEVLVTARVIAADDADATYNEVSERIQRPQRPIKILYPGDATINQSTFIARGLAEPGKVLHLFADGFESGDITADADGRWSAEVTLPEGAHRLWGEYVALTLSLSALDAIEPARISASGCLTCIDYTNLVINPSLRWNPASFKVRRVAANDTLSAQESCPGEVGTIVRPTDRMGRTDADSWRLPVAAKALCNNENYEVSVEVSCEGGAEVNIVMSGGTTMVLTDPDGDDIFTGQFKGTDEELQAALEVTCGTEQTAYIGETEKNLNVLTVRDASTGLPIAGAEVSFITRSTWAVLSGDELGQSNPQLTNQQGQAAWGTVLTDIFRIRVSHPDYQTYRSPALGRNPARISAELGAGFNLIPKASAEPDHRFDITDAGFDSGEWRLRRGARVRLRNMDIDEHRATGAGTDLLQAQAVDTTLDTGVLAAGESVDLHFDEPGIYLLGDSEDPFNQVTITVADWLFLPVMQR